MNRIRICGLSVPDFLVLFGTWLMIWWAIFFVLFGRV